MKSQIRFTLVFLTACIASMFFHEIGHAVFGWFQGIPVLPTLAKEYILQPQVDWHQRTWISLGGVLASVIVISGSLLWYAFRSSVTSAATLAGCLIIPGVYTLRFLLEGRGHDATEWQEAQTALGASPSGHSLDLAFLVLFFAGCASLAWFRDVSLGWRSLLKSASLALLGLAIIIIVQVGNNTVFDKHFPNTRTLNVPAEIKSE
ncbi:MAG: hypothetical protein ABSF28_12705 [Terracidiphilus sp.]|jgi:hypothetical protein